MESPAWIQRLYRRAALWPGAHFYRWCAWTLRLCAALPWDAGKVEPFPAMYGKQDDPDVHLSPDYWSMARMLDAAMLRGDFDNPENWRLLSTPVVDIEDAVR